MNEFTPQHAASPAPADAVRSTTLVRLSRILAPFFVFAVLGGLLLAGHQQGWNLPKFSALFGNNHDEKDDWCAEHSVPESQCVECNSTLMPRPKYFGWCKVHGVHQCPWEHPELAQVERPPIITVADLDKAKRILDFADRTENNNKCKLHERRVQFISQEAVEKAGIEVEPVWTGPMIEAVTGNGEITYNQTLTTRLSARVPGTVFQAYKQVGEWVRKGEVLALVDAAEVGKAKSEFLQALGQMRLRSKNLESVSSLIKSGAAPERNMREAETALSEANIRLMAAQQALTNLGLPIQTEILKNLPDQQLSSAIQFLGLPEALAKTFDPRTTTANLLPVVAPVDGVVVSRETVAGEVVDTAKVLFVVVDTRQMWLNLDLGAEDARRVGQGNEIRFRADGGKEAHGTISWLSTEVDHKTRTVKVRATLDNSDGRLRANTFVTGKVILREDNKAIVVPNSAVHWEGCCHIVFVRDKDFFKEGAPKVFHVRTVRIGARDDKSTEIIAGVLPGELVAAKGSAALRAELLRGNLGEG